MLLPQWLNVWRGRQYRAEKMHLHRRQLCRVQAPCPRAPQSLQRTEQVSVLSTCPSLPSQSPPSPLLLHPPAPLVVLTIATREVRRAHAETAQNAGASVVATAGSPDRTCKGDLGQQLC